MTTLPQQILPEYPDTFLDGWKLYSIVKWVEFKIHQMLQEAEYDGHLIGLRVGYIVDMDGEAKEYSMAFGYVVDGEDSEGDDSPDDPDQSFPLTEDDIDDLYNEVHDLIAAKMPREVDFSVILETALNKKIRRRGKVCRVVQEGECNNEDHIGKRFYLRLKNSGKWRCIHKKCKNN